MNTIDIHIHGIAGYDTRTKDPEDILKIAEICGSYGVSEIIPTIYPAPINIMRENIMAVKSAMERQGEKAIGDSSRIIGVNLEGPFLNPLRCGALDKSSFIAPTEYNLKELISGFEDIVRIITISPELDGAERLIPMLRDMGIIVSMGHSDATYNEAEAGFNSGAKGITHIFNAMRGIHHREPGISGFGLLNEDIYIEVIGDPYHLHPETIKLIFGIKNPERIILVSDSIKEQGLVVSLAGGSMTITEAGNRLIGMGLNEEAVIGSITRNPKRYLGLKSA